MSTKRDWEEARTRADSDSDFARRGAERRAAAGASRGSLGPVSAGLFQPVFTSVPVRHRLPCEKHLPTLAGAVLQNSPLKPFVQLHLPPSHVPSPLQSASVTQGRLTFRKGG